MTTLATADEIYEAFRRMQSAPAGDAHAKQYDKVHRMCAFNPQAVAEVISSKRLTDFDALQLMRIGGHGGSVSRKDNHAIWDLYALLRTRQDDLSPMIQSDLDWTLKTHGY